MKLLLCAFASLLLLVGCTSKGELSNEAIYHMLQGVQQQRTPITSYDQLREPKMDYQQYEKWRQQSQQETQATSSD